MITNMITTTKENFNPYIFAGFVGLNAMSPLPPLEEQQLLQVEQKLLDIVKTKESPCYL